MISGIIAGVTTLASNFVKGRTEISKAKVEAKKIKIEADADIRKSDALNRRKLAEQGQLQDHDADMQSMRNMKDSWKDEFLLLIFLTPFIMCFIPKYQAYVDEGFKVLSRSVPDWYVYIVIGMVVVIYGMRGLLTKLLSLLGNKFKLK